MLSTHFSGSIQLFQKIRIINLFIIFTTKSFKYFFTFIHQYYLIRTPLRCRLNSIFIITQTAFQFHE